MVGAAVAVVGAANTCTTNQLSSVDFVLFRFVRGCLKKCFGLSGEWVDFLVEILRVTVEDQLWNRLRCLPLHSIGKQ